MTPPPAGSVAARNNSARLKHRPVTTKLSGMDLAKLAFFALMSLGTGFVFIATPDLLPSSLLSVLIYFVFAPVVDTMERRGVARGHAILALFLGGAALIAVGVTAVLPRISNELDSLGQGKSRYMTTLETHLQAEETHILGGFPMFRDMHLAKKAPEWIEQSVDHLWKLAPEIASQLMVIMMLVPVLALMLLKEAPTIRRELLRLVPNRYFETIYSLSSRILDQMGGYVSARILEAAMITGIVTVGCLALKIPYAFLLGVFAGATNPIPYLGMVLGAAPGLVLALIAPEIPNQLVYFLAIIAVANVIDMIVIFPVVVAKIVDLHPVVVIVSVMLGSRFFGILGMILAVPVTSIVKIFLQEIYSRLYES